MNHHRVTLAHLATLVGLLAFAPPARLMAQSGGVTLTFYPDSLPLGLLGTTDVQVVVRNASGKQLSSVRVSAVSVPGLRATLDTTVVASLPMDEAMVRTLRVEQIDASQGPPAVPSLLVRLDYRQGEGAGAAKGVAIAPLKLVAGRYARVEDVVSAEVLSSLAYLSDRQDGPVYVLIHNKSAVGVTVGKPEVVPLPDTEILPDSSLKGGTSLVAPPFSTVHYPLRVKARNRVRPGKHLLVMTIPLEWMDGARSVKQSLVLSRELEVGVFGESDILKLLGVPSLLVLPGFLIVMTFALLWQFVPIRQRAANAEFALKAKEADFWFVAITLSLGVAMVSYLALGGWFLTDYGLLDVIKVWIESIMVGAAGYFAWEFWMRERDRRAAARVKKREAADRAAESLRTPATEDDPTTLLAKVGRRGDRLPRRAVQVELRGKQLTLFPVADDGQAPQIWLVPPVRVEWNEDKDEAAEAGRRDKLTSLVTTGNPAELAEFLSTEAAEHRLSVVWMPVDGVAGPIQIARPSGAPVVVMQRFVIAD